MAELWQFVSRSDMTRDKMSQALEACRLGLGAWGLTSASHCLGLPPVCTGPWSIEHGAWLL